MSAHCVVISLPAFGGIERNEVKLLLFPGSNDDSGDDSSVDRGRGVGPLASLGPICIMSIGCAYP